MSNGAQEAMWYRGYRVQGCGAHGQWDTWAILHIGNRGKGAMGYTGYGVQGVWSTGGMGHMDNRAHGQ